MRHFIVVALLTFGAAANAQVSLDSAENLARHSSQSPLYLLLPQEIRTGYILRDFIRTDAFGSFDSSHSARTVFNEIYYTSVARSHGDLTEAFFAAMFGCLEHEYLPIDLLRHEFDVPLTSESHGDFLIRQAHLPKHLYRTPEDDRDKLQHFFASAWLKSWLGMDCLVALGGELVELFESTFVEGSSRDPRDIHANEDGAHFAIKAAQNLSAPPSKSLTNNP